MSESLAQAYRAALFCDVLFGRICFVHHRVHCRDVAVLEEALPLVCDFLKDCVRRLVKIKAELFAMSGPPLVVWWALLAT